jgi:hypothetical protein
VSLTSLYFDTNQTATRFFISTRDIEMIIGLGFFFIDILRLLSFKDGAFHPHEHLSDHVCNADDSWICECAGIDSDRRDSWASGVAYNLNSVYKVTDRETCSPRTPGEYRWKGMTLGLTAPNFPTLPHMVVN